MMSLTRFFLSFQYALRGIILAFSQRNMKIHGLATILVFTAGVLLPLSATEWFIVFLLIGLVWSAEMFNSSLESLADIVRDTNKLAYPATRDPRDLASGAVLVICTVAALIGLFIFLPKIF